LHCFEIEPAGCVEFAQHNAEALSDHNFTASAAGSYAVIITTPGGSITSTAATLTVLLRPSISGIVAQPNGTVTLDFTGTPNSTNRLWVATNLVPPVVWSVVSTNVAAPDGTWQLTDTNTAGYPLRFYRVSMP